MAMKSVIEYDHNPQPFSREIIGPSSSRIAIILIPPAVGRVTLANDPVTADGAGLIMAAGGQPLYLDIDECGDVVQRGWHGLYSAGATPLSWIQALP